MFPVESAYGFKVGFLVNEISDLAFDETVDHSVCWSDYQGFIYEGNSPGASFRA